VWLCGCDGKPRREWSKLSSYCSAQCLSGGRILICEVKRLSVRGRQDEMLWHWEPAANTEVGIASARQLPDGNTFVKSVGRTLEVGPDGEEVYGWRGRGRVDENYGIERVDSGQVVSIVVKNSLVVTVLQPPNPGRNEAGTKWPDTFPGGSRVKVLP